jgi:hypothetical protein
MLNRSMPSERSFVKKNKEASNANLLSAGYTSKAPLVMTYKFDKAFRTKDDDKYNDIMN